MSEIDVKNFINEAKYVKESINSLETIIQELTNEDFNKVDYANLCLCLHGFRSVADALDALLLNRNVLPAPNGEYYQKVEDENENPTEVSKDEPKNKE